MARIEIHYMVQRFDKDDIRRPEFVMLDEDDLREAAQRKAGEDCDSVEFVRMEIGD